MGKPERRAKAKPEKRRSVGARIQEEVKKRKDKTFVTLPKSAKECSANWKVLCQELKRDRKPSFKEDKSSDIRKHTKRKAEKPTADVSSGTKRPEIWFDDIPEDEILQAEGISSANDNNSATSSTDQQLIKQNAFDGLTKAVGMDCEMVGTGYNGSQSLLARVSLVNQHGKCIYDKHVKAREAITDYRTWVSGIRPSDLTGAEEFDVIQTEVAKILKGRILVGHALHNDLKVLYLTHPKKLIRDTAEYQPFYMFNNGRTPSLRVLSKKILGVQVQNGEHSSVQDAQAAMKLFMMHKKQWEKELKLQKTTKQ